MKKLDLKKTSLEDLSKLVSPENSGLRQKIRYLMVADSGSRLSNASIFIQCSLCLPKSHSVLSHYLTLYCRYHAHPFLFFPHSEQNLSNLMLSLIFSPGHANSKLLFSKRTHYFSLELRKPPFLSTKAVRQAAWNFQKPSVGYSP